jgi:hypothetical protein
LNRLKDVAVKAERKNLAAQTERILAKLSWEPLYSPCYIGAGLRRFIRGRKAPFWRLGIIISCKWKDVSTRLRKRLKRKVGIVLLRNLVSYHVVKKPATGKYIAHIARTQTTFWQTWDYW